TSSFIGAVSLGNAVGVTTVSGFKNSINNARSVPSQILNDTIIQNAYVFTNLLANGNLLYNRFQVSAYRLLKQSKRDIFSKWGQAIFMNIYGTPFGGDYSGGQFSIYGLAYFPGLFKHHSLWGYLGYQKSEISMIELSANNKSVIENYNYLFRNQIPLPRGLGVSRFKDMYSMSINYTMPLLYPDISLGPILNIQRIRINGFIDYAYGSGTANTSISKKYLSVGGELKFDINVMRLLPQFDIGFRYSYGITPTTSLLEVLIGTLNF
ncbi:MAG: hypothetical protein ACKO96_47130, partial [Flammeovirgaceae bacterium]